MIRTIVPEMVRKTGEQGVYETVERGQGKTLGEIACATCQSQQVCTQVTRMNGPISRAASSHVEVLYRGERGILWPMPPHEDKAREKINDHIFFVIY